MSLLDRAFVKAYTRSQTKPTPAEPSPVAAPHFDPAAVSQSTAPRHVLTFDPPIDSHSVASWNSVVDETFFRVDVGHVQPSKQAVPPAVPRSVVAVEALSLPITLPADAPEIAARSIQSVDGSPAMWPTPEDDAAEFFRATRDRETAIEFARAKSETLAIPPQPIAAATVAKFATEPAALVQTVADGNASLDPLWEVDALEFSDTVLELFGNAKLMKSIGTPLDEAVSRGLRTMLVTSGGRGVGRTTVAIGIAVSAAAAGLRVALVDADDSNECLADSLRLEIEHGWTDAVRVGVSLDEIAVRSIEDQLTIIPQRSVPRSALRAMPTAGEFQTMLTALRQSFDLVVIDGTSWDESADTIAKCSAIDAAVVVVDQRKRDESNITEVMESMRRAGVAGLGIVENFALPN